MQRLMLFCIFIGALILTTKEAPNRTEAARLPSKVSITQRSQPRIGINERSHLMYVSALYPVPVMIEPDVIDFSVWNAEMPHDWNGFDPELPPGYAYVKSNGDISSAANLCCILDVNGADAKGVKVTVARNAEGYVNIAWIGLNNNVGGAPGCLPGLVQCVFSDFLTTNSYNEHAVDVALGREHVLILDDAGNVKSYGTSPGHNVLIPLVGTVAAISANDWHNLFVLQNGRVRAVGDNTYCQSAQTSEGFTYPDDIRNAVQVAAGPTHSLALLSNGTVVGWGCDSSATATARVPEAIPPPDIAGRVVDISTSLGISAALLSDGTVRLWGSYCSVGGVNHCAIANRLVNVAKIILAIDTVFNLRAIAYAIIMDPIITSTSATTFPINGGALTINGEYLKNAAVYVDGRAVIPSVNTSNQLVVTVPRHKIGKARVDVMGYSRFTTKFDITYSGSLATPTNSRTPTLTRLPTTTRTATLTPTATSIKTTPSLTPKSFRVTKSPTRTVTLKPKQRP